MFDISSTISNETAKGLLPALYGGKLPNLFFALVIAVFKLVRSLAEIESPAAIEKDRDDKERAPVATWPAPHPMCWALGSGAGEAVPSGSLCKLQC